MPINPLIALQVRPPDASKSIGGITDDILNRRRDDKILDLNERRTEAANKSAEAKLVKAQQEAEQKALEAAQKGYTADIVRVDGLVKAGMGDRAVDLLTARRDRLLAEGKDASDTEQLINLAQTNPEGFQKEIAVELDAAQRLGILNEVKDTSFTLAPGAKRFDSQGNEIASAPAKSDVKSPEAMAQALQLIRERARVSAANNPASQAVAALAGLRMESLRLANEEKRNAIDSKARKEADEKLAAEEEKVKQFTFLEETKEIVDRLLTPAGREAVESAAGPIGSLVPTIRDATADAEIDIETIKSRLTKDNLGLLKGVISDSDIRFLGRIAAGGLDLSGSDEGVIRELSRIQANIGAAVNTLGEDAAAESPPESVKTIEGVHYEKRGGRWFRVN